VEEGEGSTGEEKRDKNGDRKEESRESRRELD
jgi:hypothetical protein